MTTKRMARFKFVFDIGSISGLQALALVVDVFKKFSSNSVFYLCGIESDIKTLEKTILKKSWPSGLMVNGFNLRFGLLPALKQCFLVIEDTGGTSIELEEEIWPILSVEGFIQAWISDVEYDFWQNATDPLEYEDVGRSFSDLPLRSNGLPAPLEQMEIDTSGNPGRNILRQGYVEAIGSKMWLSDLFWKRVNIDKSISFSLLEVYGFKVYKCGRFITAVASENIFFDDSTVVQQRALRQILFGVA